MDRPVKEVQNVVDDLSVLVKSYLTLCVSTRHPCHRIHTEDASHKDLESMGTCPGSVPYKEGRGWVGDVVPVHVGSLDET